MGMDRVDWSWIGRGSSNIISSQSFIASPSDQRQTRAKYVSTTFVLWCWRDECPFMVMRTRKTKEIHLLRLSSLCWSPVYGVLLCPGTDLTLPVLDFVCCGQPPESYSSSSLSSVFRINSHQSWFLCVRSTPPPHHPILVSYMWTGDDRPTEKTDLWTRVHRNSIPCFNDDQNTFTTVSQ